MRRQRQTYTKTEMVVRGRTVVLPVCTGCGAVVVDRAQHEIFHSKIGTKS